MPAPGWLGYRPFGSIALADSGRSWFQYSIAAEN